jgi:D-3-phosphoglycerate dehydrogenase / 2-oxoglutarate reductase
MKVLYLGQDDNLQPWLRDVVTAVGEEHEVRLYAADRPLAAQLRDVRVVIDQGGGVGTRATVDAAAAAGVELWQVLGTGLDHVDVAYILGQGLTLANTPGQFSSVALAEHALFFMLYFAKRLPECQRNLRAGRFYRPLNDELAGATLGLVGLGASGRELAKRAAALDMRLVGLDAQAPPARLLAELDLRYLGGPEHLPELLAASDYVSLHVPLTRATHHWLGPEAFAAMRRGSVLINVARGAIVDPDGLLQALRDGTLRGAGLDVFAEEPLPPDHPLLRLDNVLATPHVAGVTSGTSRRRAAAVAENVRRVASGLPPLHTVRDLS